MSDPYKYCPECEVFDGFEHSKTCSRPQMVELGATPTFELARDEAWAAREHLKYDPLPLHEIAKGEFDAGANWSRKYVLDSPEVRGLVEKLEKAIELANVPERHQDEHWYAELAFCEQALAAWKKARGSDENSL